MEAGAVRFWGRGGHARSPHARRAPDRDDVDAPVPPGALLVLNAMSNNRGMRWSIAETEAALKVQALDDSRA